MDRHEVNDPWSTEDPMAAALIDNGDGMPEAAQSDSQPTVLGRIPDVDATKSEKHSGGKSRRSDGRLISQGLSTKLLLGGGALLVLAAIVPLLLGRSQPEGGLPPAPDAESAPAFDAAVAQGSAAPATTPGIQQAAPQLDFAPNIPTGPAFTLNVPDSPHDTAGHRLPSADRAPSDAGAYRVERPESGYGRQYQPPQDAPEQPQARLNRKMMLHDPVPGVARLDGIIVK